MFSVKTETPLPSPGGEGIQGLAFDGCCYYLTARCRREIYVLNADFRLLKTVQTQRIYMALTYDALRGGFWAVADWEGDALFRLDGALRETDRLPLCPGAPVSGVSVCCDSGTLIVTRGNQVLILEPEAGKVRLLREEPGCALACTPLCLPPYVLYTALRERKPYFVLLSREGTVVKEISAEEPARALAVGCGPSVLALTLRRNCYPFLLRLRLPDPLADSLSPCLGKLCCRCPEENNCRDILESIALQEAAIAHILNAEGEKLQWAIREACSVEALLRVNASVQQTMLGAVQLEQVLLAKLQTVCGCREDTAPPCTSNCCPEKN